MSRVKRKPTRFFCYFPKLVCKCYNFSYFVYAFRLVFDNAVARVVLSLNYCQKLCSTLELFVPNEMEKQNIGYVLTAVITKDCKA